MSSRSKKGPNWEEKIIGFKQLDDDYSNVFTAIIADYRQFQNVASCVFINSIESYTKRCTKVIMCKMYVLFINAF